MPRLQVLGFVRYLSEIVLSACREGVSVWFCRGLSTRRGRGERRKALPQRHRVSEGGRRLVGVLRRTSKAGWGHISLARPPLSRRHRSLPLFATTGDSCEQHDAAHRSVGCSRMRTPEKRGKESLPEKQGSQMSSLRLRPVGRSRALAGPVPDVWPVRRVWADY